MFSMVEKNKRFLFLIPALLTVFLVLNMIPRTEAVLREIPEKLALVEEVEAKDSIGRGGDDDVEAGVGHYEDGVYTGQARGYGGMISVQVTVKDGQITDIRILSAPGETEPYFSLAKGLVEQVKTAQTWEIDAASGDTYSS